MFATTTSPPFDPGNVEAKLSCSDSLLFALDGLAMNLEKGYRPAGDLIIEDADYQPAGIPSLCIEVCPTFYRDWTIPELVMPVHDMSRSVTALIGTLVDLPQQLVRILRGERQIRIDAGVHVDPMPVNVHQRERLDPAKLLLRHDLHVDDVTIILSVGDQGGPATIIHPSSSLDWLTAALPHDVFVIALEADQFQVGRSPVHQPLDDLATLRPTIDIVAEGNDCRRSIRLRVLNDLRYRFRKEVVAPMQIGNCVGKRHHLTLISSTSAARAITHTAAPRCARSCAVVSRCHERRPSPPPLGCAIPSAASSPCALVCLVDQPHDWAQIVHADWWRRASPPVIERIAHCGKIGRANAGAWEGLVALGGGELNDPVLHGENCVAAGDLPLTISAVSGEAIADLNGTENTARRAEHNRSVVFNRALMRAPAQLGASHLRLLAGQVKEHVQPVRPQVPEAPAAGLGGIEHPSAIPGLVARRSRPVEPDVDVRQRAKAPHSEQLAGARGEGRVALG